MGVLLVKGEVQGAEVFWTVRSNFIRKGWFIHITTDQELIATPRPATLNLSYKQLNYKPVVGSKSFANWYRIFSGFKQEMPDDMKSWWKHRLHLGKTKQLTTSGRVTYSLFWHIKVLGWINHRLEDGHLSGIEANCQDHTLWTFQYCAPKMWPRRSRWQRLRKGEKQKIRKWLFVLKTDGRGHVLAPGHCVEPGRLLLRFLLHRRIADIIKKQLQGVNDQLHLWLCKSLHTWIPKLAKGRCADPEILASIAELEYTPDSLSDTLDQIWDGSSKKVEKFLDIYTNNRNATLSFSGHDITHDHPPSNKNLSFAAVRSGR